MAKKYQKNPASRKRTCVLCGRSIILEDDTSCIIGSTGRAVCYPCLRTSRTLLDAFDEASKQVDKEENKDTGILTPQEIICRLDKAIIGQEDAKKAVAIAFWKQQLRARGEANVPSGNLLLYGPTGCGKTALVREASKIVGLPFLTFDTTTLSEAGYRGRDAQEIIQDLNSCFQDHPHLKNSVVFLDEVDKLAAVGSEQRMAYSRGTQHSLLKLIEGTEVDGLSTEGILFVFGGAFSRLTSNQEQRTGLPHHIGFGDRADSPADKRKREIGVSDFVCCGMEAELMGRIGQCVPLRPLTREEMRQILLDSELSVFKQYQRFFQARGIQLQISDKRVDELIDCAQKRGTGARGLNTLLEEAMQPLLFRLAGGTTAKQLELDGGTAYAG